MSAAHHKSGSLFKSNRPEEAARIDKICTTQDEDQKNSAAVFGLVRRTALIDFPFRP